MKLELQKKWKTITTLTKLIQMNSNENEND